MISESEALSNLMKEYNRLKETHAASAHKQGIMQGVTRVERTLEHVLARLSGKS